MASCCTCTTQLWVFGDVRGQKKHRLWLCDKTAACLERFRFYDDNLKGARIVFSVADCLLKTH